MSIPLQPDASSVRLEAHATCFRTATCGDPPGVREGATVKLYLAYLRDPDGNKIGALYRMPRA